MHGYQETGGRGGGGGGDGIDPTVRMTKQNERGKNGVSQRKNGISASCCTEIS